MQAATLAQLLAMARQGREDAWRSIVAAYGPRMFGLLVRQCGDRELAEEITQATFVKVVEQLGRLGHYEEQRHFEAWLFRIAMNGLRDEMRRRKRQARPMDFSPGSIGAEGVNERVDDREAGPAESAGRAEQVELVRRAVAQLPEQDREILHLRHTAGLSFAQIAETLQEPLGTVLARGHRALGKLKILLAEHEP